MRSMIASMSGTTADGRLGHHRASLLLGCAAAVVLSLAIAQAVPAPAADVELALLQLMRGMAAIKAALALIALAAVWWRLGRPLSCRLAAAYIAGTCVLAAAPALIWQMAWVPATAFVFHVAEIGLLVVAWRDGAARRRHHDP
jgi:hypothetical protein